MKLATVQAEEDKSHFGKIMVFWEELTIATDPVVQESDRGRLAADALKAEANTCAMITSRRL